MAGNLVAGGVALQPSAEQVALSTNYITNFDFLNQYLPDTYEKEFERYGNRTISGFLRMVGAEMPSNSDLIKWAEQGRLHTKYTTCTLGTYTGAETVQTVTVPAAQLIPGTGTIAVRVGQTVFLTDETAASTFSNKAIVTGVGVAAGLLANQFNVAYYEATQAAYAAASTITMFAYGSEFQKGTNGMVGSLEADDLFLSNLSLIHISEPTRPY